MVSAVVRRRSVDAIPWVVLVVLIGVDTASTGIVISGAYPTAAVVASTMASVRRTAYVAASSVAFAGLSVLWNDYQGPGEFWLRFALSAALAVVAVLSALVRVRREEALANMTVIAETVQQAVLRTIPSQVGALGFATQYQSATSAALVGGDLFEVAQTGHGVRVILGDVRGKGMEAVQLAATVLAAFRRAAFSQEQLTGVATEIDMVVRAVAGDEDFVTAILCQFTAGGQITVVNRGHHPPLLIPPASASASFLDTGDPQPPLGLGSVSHSMELTWPPQARLLLYTDGLVEARDRKGTFFPLESKAPTLATGELGAVLAGLIAGVQEFTRYESTDDIALMLVENRDPASPSEPAPPA
ncbi:MAG: Stage II sporulation protein E [uncultured Nocardioidaceae bacterium]|uniref:Stage II sporulation protein E n=1 Tax=uncultured Nocardioidaceae bacterium TaxID=253824 RepID=A0A6J4LXR4_9ACTN|nr:MAG: Stage II sporulation protein E [uncultured Nocardioidaceae bacterium]